MEAEALLHKVVLNIEYFSFMTTVSAATFSAQKAFCVVNVVLDRNRK